METRSEIEMVTPGLVERALMKAETGSNKPINHAPHSWKNRDQRRKLLKQGSVDKSHFGSCSVKPIKNKAGENVGVISTYQLSNNKQTNNTSGISLAIYATISLHYHCDIEVHFTLPNQINAEAHKKIQLKLGPKSSGKPGNSHQTMIVCTSLKPFETVFIANVKSDENIKFKLRTKVRRQSRDKKINIRTIKKTQSILESAKLSEWPIDEEFPPNYQSLVNPEGQSILEEMGLNHEELVDWDQITWRRLRDIFPKSRFKLVNYKVVEPSDIRQGILGDCWVCSALSALAEQPSLIQRLFDGQSQASKDFHSVWLCQHGEWTRVTMDDFVPCHLFGSRPAFINCDPEELPQGTSVDIWPMLLEKAYAKHFGSFDLLIAGNARDALHDFTGFPVESVSLEMDLDCSQDACPLQKQEFADQTWKKLRELVGRDRHSVCVASCHKEGVPVGEVELFNGMHSGHAYALLGAVQIHGQRLVKLRNPWGLGEWKGPWSDDDFQRWTPALMKKLKHKPDNKDGTFFMPFEDFMECFIEFDVCHVRTDWTEARLALDLGVDRSSVHCPVYRIHVSCGKLEWIGVHQPDTRDNETFHTQELAIAGVIFKDAGHAQNIAHHRRWSEPELVEYLIHNAEPISLIKSSHFHNFFEQVSLDPGEYYVMLYTASAAAEKHEVSRKVVLSAHVHSADGDSSRISQMNNINVVSMETAGEVFHPDSVDLLLSHSAIKLGTQEKLHDAMVAYKLRLGYIYLMALQNQTDTHLLNTTVKVQSVNMHFAQGYGAQKILALAPNQTRTAYVMEPEDRESAWNYGYSMSFKAVRNKSGVHQ